MASMRSEYHRFLTHLAQRQVHDDVRRLAHLVLEHLQPLAEVSAAGRRRSGRLAPLAIAHLAQAPVAYQGDGHGPDAGPALGRLHQLEVGPFRGFMRQETFDLSHDITLVYGANGTGKSSFCEALEVAMLGSISEAQVKRVDQRTYCNNARLRRHVAPVLSSRAADEPQAVQPDEAEYRFCFIEKNRLDDFARIAARTPGDQRQLIATLFGVDQFSDFVRGFNPALDQDLMLAGVQAAQLAQRRLQLANSEQTIAAYPEKIAAIEGLEQALAQRMPPDAAYQGCVDWLLGTPQQQGRLPYVQAQLVAVPPAVYEVTQARLQGLLDEAYRLQGLWQAATEQLAARAGEVSYAKLYEAVLALADGATACPACGTGLAAVAQDPFAKARAGLEQLAQLAALQQQEAGLRTQLSEAVRVLWEEMRRVVTAAAAACPAQLQAAALPPLPPAATGTWLGAWVDGDRRGWIALLQVAEFIERVDAQSREAHALRGALAQERDALDQHRLEIERLRTLRTTADQELATACQTVAQFDEANRALIDAAAAEVPVVAHHQRIQAAYNGYLPEIQAYLAALPGLLLQGLGEQARNLYNAFNRADPPGDLLHALWLPVAENGKIEVEFAGEPGVRYDALVVFSEGHIKCLGLAILLAKNIAQGCPVVIFDDVVNAIDDDHRDGIWRTFFEDGLLDGKQVILTSHAEEFLHRIQQELGARRAGAIKRYKFLPHQGEHELRVDSDPPTKNYVLLAQKALAADEKREALRQARPALESLTDRLWTWLGRRADGRIELKLGGPRSPWELNNKCAKLRSAVDRISAQHAGAPAVVAALTQLLGVGSGSMEWGCLNSGVHDSQRDHEFDRAIVTVVVESVAALDAALDVLQNR
ncbi:ATP-binding protein [Achromobacter xylosoxidans]|uniref:ATP-binding protein n=1 Tax=Alcaligenes xylosoxydans xylosoxydans TaxID=85698 RepID=UPI001F129AAF|nr:ATP-binding protein [Achromobacter xylosoxidans]